MSEVVLHTCVDYKRSSTLVALSVIRECCCNALNILDRFHIVAKMNDALNDVRAAESRQLVAGGYDRNMISNTIASPIRTILRHKSLFLLSTSLAGWIPCAQAAELRVASWNLGWHVSQAEIPNWIAQCSKAYQKDSSDGVWKPTVSGGTVGWLIKESRAKLQGVDLAVMPPCGVYQDNRFQGLAVTPKALATRSRQISDIIAKSVQPDVIAFQEVSGTQAVMEALGEHAGEYRVCSHDTKFKIQRLAFAWKKEFGEPAEACATIDALALPALPVAQQVRPGYQVGLRINGKLIRFMTVHLKSGCVSPLDRGVLDRNSRKDDPCPVLQQQVQPLEHALEKLGSGNTSFVLIGDVNRNLWHEANEVTGAKSLRSDGSTDLTKTRNPEVLTQNLFKEINDGVPPSSKATLLELACPGDKAMQALCMRSKTESVPRKELGPLASKDGLGCRNPVALDQILVSDDLAPKVREARKIAIGRYGRSLGPTESKPDPLLAVSDHCPSLVMLDL